MNTASLERFRDVYRDGLLEDTIPFWLEHAIDTENGGIYSCLDRTGKVIDTDKSVWVQGRFVWLMATLYRTAQEKQEWIDAAGKVLDFLRAHCFDSDGRMFFTVTADGKPLRKRRYLFSECFAVAALSAFASATGDKGAAAEALALFKLIIRYYTTPGLLPEKGFPDTRQSRSIAMPMMLLNIAQDLRTATGDPLCDEWIDRAIEEMITFHVKTDPYKVLETVGSDGGFQDHFEGRKVTPGHIIEAAWFILDESRKRGGDAKLTEAACRMIDWSWQLGWDKEYGGMIYFRDISGLPGTEYWHDMKFWWQQNESIIATLLAYHMTGQAKYSEWHQRIHDWTYKRYPDPESGEWFGYLHRDGRVSTELKGNMWKGPFHLPRMQWYCWKLAEEMLE